MSSSLRRIADHLRKRRVALPLALFLLVFIAFNQVGCSLFGYHGVEEWPSETLSKDGKFEIRQYEAAAVASTVVAPGEGDPANQGFRRLAGYIFGENAGDTKIAMTAPVVMQPDDAGKKIAMTAPVTMEQTERGWEMSFVLPSDYTAETAPTPNDNRVSVSTDPGGTYAVYRYSGFFSQDDLVEYAPRLQAWLKSQGYRESGPMQIAGYDPPFTLPWFRRNEVLVQVEVIEE